VSDARLSTLRRAALTGDLSARVAWLSEWLRTDPACEECSGSGHHLVARRVAYGGAPHHMDYVWHPDGPCSACHGTGTQRRWRVELAAYVGDEAAIAVAGEQFGHMGERAVVAHWAPVLSDWARGLSRWGRETCVRAAVAAAWAAFLAWADGSHAGQGCTPTHLAGTCVRVVAARRAIEGAEAWLSCPCEEHRVACVVVWESGPLPDFAFHLLAAVLATGRGEGARDVCESARFAVTGPPSNSDSFQRGSSAVRLASESSVRSAIQRSLTEWALSPPGP
jgi:hypothetical protein